MLKTIRITVQVIGCAVIFIFWALFATATHSGAPTKPIHYPGIGNDPLLAHPISMNCREAYTVLCPEYHGD